MSDTASVKLIQEQDYLFQIFAGTENDPIHGDEPPPLGNGKGPSPAQFLAIAVSNCLSDSLLFAMRKYKQDPNKIETSARCEITRNTQNRLRVSAIYVDIKIHQSNQQLEHMDRILTQFREFCTVSSSISPFIPVTIQVKDLNDHIIFSD